MAYVEASIAASASSGASQSGAKDYSGGGNYGGISYGPGSYVTGGESSQPSVASTPFGKVALVIAAIVAILLIAPLFLKGRK